MLSDTSPHLPEGKESKGSRLIHLSTIHNHLVPVKQMLSTICIKEKNGSVGKHTDCYSLGSLLDDRSQLSVHRQSVLILCQKAPVFGCSKGDSHLFFRCWEWEVRAHHHHFSIGGCGDEGGLCCLLHIKSWSTWGQRGIGWRSMRGRWDEGQGRGIGIGSLGI